MAVLERALIAGAGLAGLALAGRLKALGVAVDLIERRFDSEGRGAGILLTGNAMRALSALDPSLGARVLALGRLVRSVRFTDDQEIELFRVDCAAHETWPPFVSIQRELLQRALFEAAHPIVPRWGTTIARQLGDGEVELSDGTRGTYDLVVGADGVHSQMRQLLFGPRPAERIDRFFGWRFLAPCPPGLEHPQYMLGNGRTMLLHPMPGGEVYVGAGPIFAAEGADDLEKFRRAFETFGGTARAVIDAVEDPSRLIPTRYWQVEQRPWSVGRCVLIGDAVHASAPTLAQGGAMAFEDALVLGELLAARGVEDALAALEARRAARVAHVQKESLLRMDANRPVDARTFAVRRALLKKVGATQLEAAWAPLMEEPP